MDDKQAIAQRLPAGRCPDSTYNESSHLVDFVLGITFEIWEQRQVELILKYYADKVKVYSLDGITQSAASMVQNTQETLASYPDRLLLGDEIIYSGNCAKGFSSHRLISPMTQKGANSFGPATGRRARIMNIADCELSNGQITREWLVRDNLALVNQLGFEPAAAARSMAENFDSTLIDWIEQEFRRTSEESTFFVPGPDSLAATEFARTVLNACWLSGDRDAMESAYAPYSVLHRSPVELYSGRARILEHFAAWRSIFPNANLSIDHVCTQPLNTPGDGNCQNIAVRWSIASRHEGTLAGIGPSQKPTYILGVTHWRVVDGRIATECTVFDQLAVMAQIIRQTG
jgi:predicted ester cyclase